MSENRPRGIEHVGITVPDHGAALRFFRDAFGAEPLFSLVKPGDPPMRGEEMRPKTGQALWTAVVALSMLRLRNGANLEIFEIDRPNSSRSAGIADHGISHFSVTVDDVDATAARFEAAGGTLLEGSYDLTGHEAGLGNRGRFGLTPWGLLIEFESFHSPIRYDEGVTATRWLPDRN